LRFYTANFVINLAHFLCSRTVFNILNFDAETSHVFCAVETGTEIGNLSTTVLRF